MPYDKAGKGSFEPEGKKDKRKFNYEIESWVKQGDFPHRRSGKRLKVDDLHNVDFMVVRSSPEDEPDNQTFDTVWGPFDDWDFLEGFLAYDYGDEGSLLQVASS